MINISFLILFSTRCFLLLHCNRLFLGESWKGKECSNSINFLCMTFLFLLSLYRKKELTKEIFFNAICHFFGYQVRGSLPSKFDYDYAYVLGHICYHILAAGLNGYMATVTNLKNPANKWHCGDAPYLV